MEILDMCLRESGVSCPTVLNEVLRSVTVVVFVVVTVLRVGDKDLDTTYDEDVIEGVTEEAWFDEVNCEDVTVDVPIDAESPEVSTGDDVPMDAELDINVEDVKEDVLGAIDDVAENDPSLVLSLMISAN